jgi:hypothetical protein
METGVDGSELGNLEKLTQGTTIRATSAISFSPAVID